MNVSRLLLASLALIPAVSLLAAQPVLAQGNPARNSQSAAPASGDSSRIVTNVTQADLLEIVSNGDHSVVSQQKQGDVSVLARSPDGLLFVLIGKVCDLPDYGPGCLAVEFQVRYDSDSRVSWENLNLVNQSYAMTKAWFGQDEAGKDTVFISYYAVLDDGQTMKNLETILLNVLEIGPMAAETIFP